MTEFIAFALYICLSCFLLIAVPAMMIPGLSMKRKLLICLVTFFILVPLALLIYAWVGAPQLATSR